MGKSPSRTPRGYDGVGCTNQHVSDILPKVLKGIHKHAQDQSLLILSAWSTIIGPQLAPMTKAVMFKEGVLMVKVKNSTLYSLLVRHDKPKLLGRLRAQFPKVDIKNIDFRIG